MVYNLLIINSALWLVTWMASRTQSHVVGNLMGSLALYPPDSGLFRIWQPLTYMFMHGSWEHVIFNMFTLWMFGRVIEYDLRSRRFLIYYIVCGVGAGLIQLAVAWFTGSMAATVGASGAIYGLLLAFGMLHPNDIIMPLFPPIPMKAKWAVSIFAGIELLLGIRNMGAISSADNVAHFAHLGGALFGFVLLWWWKRQWRGAR